MEKVYCFYQIFNKQSKNGYCQGCIPDEHNRNCRDYTPIIVVFFEVEIVGEHVSENMEQ